MLIKQIIDEDFVNYKKPSMFLCACRCDHKCCIEQDLPLNTCQNLHLLELEDICMDDWSIYQRYIANPITSAIVVGGLEPMLQPDELYKLIKTFRDNGCEDEFVIYTGYTYDEIQDSCNEICQLGHIVWKFGRFIPNDKPRKDPILGVVLASSNQYGWKTSDFI